MGRCNNRRTQEQAQALRNLPSRARFSNNPPAFLAQKNAKKKRGKNSSSTSTPQQSTTASAPTTAARQRVVDRMAHRLANHGPPSAGPTPTKPPPPVASSSSSADRYLRTGLVPTPTFRGRVEDLDSLELSEDAVERIYRLLAARGVIQSQSSTYHSGELSGAVAEPLEEEDNDPDYVEEGDGGDSENGDVDADDGQLYDDTYRDDGDENDDGLTSKSLNRWGRSDYHDEAAEDSDGALDATYKRSGSHVQDHFDANWEGSVTVEKSSQPRERDGGETLNGDDDDSDAAFRNDPVFRYLTTTLSFSHRAAGLACRSLEHWQGSTASKKAVAVSHEGSGDPAPGNLVNGNWTARLGLAVDWLSLHLEEGELAAGFRRNPTQSWSTGPTIYSAVPHPSISVATKLTKDADFLRRIRLDERSLGFVQLGFPYTDVISLLEQQSTDSMNGESIDDDATLRGLLSKVEQEHLDCTKPHIQDGIDQEYLLEQREQEREVLGAVYDSDFEVVSQSSDLWARYKIKLPGLASIVVGAACTDEDLVAHLHVFLRPGYPQTETPLLLFVFPHCDVALIRKINRDIMRHAVELRGAPCIFETATYLTANLEAMVADHRKELRAKEFEAQQHRTREVANRELISVAGLEESGRLGRRQLAKLKSEERCYDASEVEEQKQLERRRRQEARLQRVKEQDRFLRQSMAEMAIQRREKERLEEGVRAAGRAAMLSALNQGASQEEARSCSEKAVLAFRKEHGLVDSVTGRDVGDNGDTFSEENAFDRDQVANSGNVDSGKPRSTPTTSAFMERLRAMYDSAAKTETSVVRLKIGEKTMNQSRLPCPLATYTGELAGVIDDVVSIQTEQPWLISREARIPELKETETSSKHCTLSQSDPDELSKLLKQELEQLYSRPQFHKILEMRKRLPAFQMKEDIVRTIARSQVTVVSGETGCGKSLCTPQLVLDDMIRQSVGSLASIIVTQPRRISAVGVAERIAYERLESVGDTCGYRIKMEKKTSRRTRILLCTTGILLRRLQCDPDLATVSHVFLDEVHERDLNTDFLLIILKNLLMRRPSLKLVLMSATLNAESFVNYFPGCQSVSIPGRAHPVKEHRLEDVLQITGYEVPQDSDYAKKNASSSAGRLSTKELRRLYPNYSSSVLKSLSIVDESVINYELLALLLRHIVEDSKEQGAILVFLPGMMEISKAFDEIRKIDMFQSSRFRIYPLHSSLSTSEQKAVFEVPPAGIRKIVLSTNIAETSVTIEDVVFVVDCGRVKENRRDEVKETPALVECWVSRASAKQRRGRAGRVKPGFAYHMYSSYTHDNVMEEHQLPEMLRVGLEDLVLQILTLDLGEPSRFFSAALNPPSALAMKNSLRLLESLGAVDCKWQGGDLMCKHAEFEDPAGSRCDALDVSTELTALGYHLATLPVDPRVGKLMIYGALFGCVDPAVTIAAALTATKPVFTSPFEQRDRANEARKAMSVDGSDILTLLWAFNEWKRLRRTKGNRGANAFVRENFMSRVTLLQMEDLRKHYVELLKGIGFIAKGFRVESGTSTRGSDDNSNAENMPLLRALLCAGLYPNIIVAPRLLGSDLSKQEAGECAFQSQSKGDVFLHPSSVSFSSKKLRSRFCCFYEIIRTSKLYVRDVTPVSALALVLFGGSIKTYPREGVITVDEWLRFRVGPALARADYAAARRVALIKHLRYQLEAMLLQKIVSPEDEVPASTDSKALIDAIVALLSETNETETKKESLHNANDAVLRPYHLLPNEGRGPTRNRPRGPNGAGRTNQGSQRSTRPN